VIRADSAAEIPLRFYPHSIVGCGCPAQNLCSGLLPPATREKVTVKGTGNFLPELLKMVRPAALLPSPGD
jgi:hypothetical protein